MRRLVDRAVILAMLTGAVPAVAQQAPPVLQGMVAVAIDHAALFTLPPETQVLIIGNPSIADVTRPAKAGNLAVITGKAFGQTNILLTDSEGRLLSAASIRVEQVGAPLVTVQRGTESRETYSCTPACAPTLSLGDSTAAFQATGTQIQQRQSIAAPPVPGYPGFPGATAPLPGAGGFAP